jgi:hypothetical protein
MSNITITQWGVQNISIAQAIEDMSNVFLNTFNKEPSLYPSTPTGAFIQELADMEVNVNNTCAYICSNVYGVDTTNGIFLDGIGNLFGIDRIPATKATITCQVAGIPNLTIAKGSIVSDGNNNFISTAIINLNSSGQGSGLFEAEEDGQITVQPNTINTILSPITGWSSVNNNTGGTLGQNIQPDTSYRFTLKYAQSINGRSFIASLYSILSKFVAEDGSSTINAYGINVPYIQGFYIYSNYTSTEQEIVSGLTPVPVGGVYISIYAPQYLANDNPNLASNLQYLSGIILNQLGANSTNNIQLDANNQFIVEYVNTEYPQIDTVTVKFDQPIEAPIEISYSIKLYGQDKNQLEITGLIQNAILEQFYNGYSQNGVIYTPATMNKDINTADYIATILNVVGGCTIQAQNIQIVDAGTEATSLRLTVDKIATLEISNIIITLE